MFKSIQDIVDRANDSGLPISALMIQQEAATQERPAQEIIDEMAASWQVMKAAAKRGLQGLRSHSGMTGGDAKRLMDYLDAGQGLTGTTFLRALAYAVSSNEVNAAMGLICATPTAGSCGVLPGVLLSAQEQLGASDEEVVNALFCAGAMGLVIANNAVISGAAGGCQAEVGTASGMAAAALVALMGGQPEQSAQALAMALKNLLGLVCDPLAGLVEVPCIKRNAGGAAVALAAAEMAMAGIQSQVPPDEVIQAMYQVGLAMPLALRETAQGGLAATPTGAHWKQLLWQGQETD
ncbi:MAG: L-serine ammonia-lyase, iron-sulfur-dependent, subunit alpha [Clostridiales bacterium]|nr:L-serine ammonia-lyase, iron-sulfur-dependent, subunit alpha [Clostridiales bacterium]